MSEIIIEEWLPIKGFEGKYEISNFGRVKSLSRIVMRRKVLEKILKLEEHYRGYHRVNIYTPAGKKWFYIHR